MDFYERKSRAITKLDSIIKSNDKISISSLTLLIGAEFGFSQKFVIEREKKYGGKLQYSNYKEIEEDFANKKIHPLDLKIAVAKEISKLLTIFQKNKAKLEKLLKEAYK